MVSRLEDCIIEINSLKIMSNKLYWAIGGTAVAALVGIAFLAAPGDEGYCHDIPELQADFDLEKFSEKAWFPLLTVNDLPYR